MNADRTLRGGEPSTAPVNPYEPSFNHIERVTPGDKNSLGKRLPFSILMALCGSIFGGLSAIATLTLIETLKSESFALEEFGMLCFSGFTLYLAYICLAFAWRFLKNTPYRNGLYFSSISIALFGLIGCITVIAMLLYHIAAIARAWFSF